EALCGGKDGATGKCPAPFRPHLRIRQEPAKAEWAAGLTIGWLRGPGALSTSHQAEKRYMATQGAFALVQREFEARRCSDAKVEGPAATFTEQIQATKYATQATPQHKLAVALHRRAIESLT